MAKVRTVVGTADGKEFRVTWIDGALSSVRWDHQKLEGQQAIKFAERVGENQNVTIRATHDRDNSQGSYTTHYGDGTSRSESMNR